VDKVVATNELFREFFLEVQILEADVVWKQMLWRSLM
jgi:hypothetical protein